MAKFVEYAVYSKTDELLFVGNLTETARYVEKSKKQVRRIVEKGENVPQSCKYKIYKIIEDENLTDYVS